MMVLVGKTECRDRKLQINMKNIYLNLMYIAHPSLAEDAKIILATIKILFMPESTEGVSEGQTTAMSGKK